MQWKPISVLLSIPLGPLGHADEPEKTHVIPGDSCYAYLRSVKGRKNVSVVVVWRAKG